MKKIYTLLCALLCMMCCSSLSYAQERFWSNAGFHTALDGADTTDVSIISLGQPGCAECYDFKFEKIFLSPGGEIIGYSDGLPRDGSDFGTVVRFTPQGIVDLYNEFLYYPENSWATDSVYFYMRTSVGWNPRLTRLRVDGTEVVSGSQNNLVPYQIVKTAYGTFGTSELGGAFNKGFIFRINDDYSGFVNIRSHNIAEEGRLSMITGGPDGFLYGTAEKRGSSEYGSVFRLRPDGSEFSVLANFSTPIGINPIDGLIYDGAGNFYGRTRSGAGGKGTIFKVDTTGSFSTVLIFKQVNYNGGPLQCVEGGYIIGSNFRVRVDGSGFEATPPPHFENGFFFEGAPADTYVTNIADGATNVPQDIHVLLKPIRGALDYRFEISTSPDFTNASILHSNMPEVSLPPLQPNAVYYTRVRPNVWPYYGEVVSFTTSAGIPEDSTQRIWVLLEPDLVSMNTDGSDPYPVRSDSWEVPDFLDAFQLSSGEIITISGVELGKITPTGYVKLYDFYDQQFHDLIHSSAEGGDGMIYALEFRNGFSGVARMNPDGTSYQTFRMRQTGVAWRSPLTNVSGMIYGVSKGIGDNEGFIFKVREDLSGLDAIYNFSIDSLGIRPEGGLLEGRNGFIYGTTRIGGRYNAGVIFRIDKNGSDYAVLHHFNIKDGKNPQSRIYQDSDGNIYGRARNGGTGGKGVLFKISEDGSNFEKIFEIADEGDSYWNSSIVIGNDGYLYGSMTGPGVFRVRTDGTGFQGLFDHGFPRVPRLLRQPFIPDVQVTDPPHLEMDVPTTLTVGVIPITKALAYTLELSESAAFAGTPLIFSSASPSFEVSGLAENTTYYARVRSSLLPYYGETTSFTTGDVVPSALNEHEVYPNPTSSTFTLKTGSGDIKSITITDANGMVVYKNENVQDVDLMMGEDLKQGIYVMKIVRSSGQKVVRLVKH